ncbi:MAG: CotH kinase family protein [Bacteroidota bacterium]
MQKSFALLSLLWLAIWTSSPAQQLFPAPGRLFEDEKMIQIHILMSPSDLEVLLDPANAFANDYYETKVVFDFGDLTDTVEAVGLRLRGNTSRAAQKKSFKLSFNTFESGRKYRGLEKLNLNGEHNDPSIARSKTCWDLCRAMEIPAPRSNHSQLYINDVYFGIYANVEHIDEVFVDLRFGSDKGNLYKCLWPADLAYLGEDPNLYKLVDAGRRVYELKTNTETDDYSRLAALIGVINNSPPADFACDLEKIFNVQSYLRSIAMDVLTGNWDGPIFNKNNFYLYDNPLSGQFEYIPYDLDNTLGINFFAGQDWTDRNLYNWSAPGSSLLYVRIMDQAEYRDQYSYYLDQFLEHIYQPDLLFESLDELRDQLREAATDDPYRPLDYGFTMQDFETAYEESLPFFHTNYGIKEFISIRRSSAFEQLEDKDSYPILEQLQSNRPSASQALQWTVRIREDGEVGESLLWYNWKNEGWQSISLRDDGQQLDDLAGDGLYSGQLSPFNEEGVLQYYIEAIDDKGQRSRLPRCEDLELNIREVTDQLYLNELMASNDQTIADEAGEFDDWLEIYNGGTSAIPLGGKYLSDDPTRPDKWAFPDVEIAPGEFILIWADEDQDQGIWHTNFKLDADGERLGIYDDISQNFALIDEVIFDEQGSDRALGRIPNGTGAFQEVAPTPGASNEPLSISAPALQNRLQLYPNPAGPYLLLDWQTLGSQVAKLQVWNAYGQLVREEDINPGSTSFYLELEQLPSAWYVLRLIKTDQSSLDRAFLKID